MLLVLDAALTGGMEYPALSDQLDQALSGTELTGLSEQELADQMCIRDSSWGHLSPLRSSGRPAGFPEEQRAACRFHDLRAAFRLDGPRQRTLWKCVPARWHCLLRFGARNCHYRPEGYCCC